jgi:hypothetical protein
MRPIPKWLPVVAVGLTLVGSGAAALATVGGPPARVEGNISPITASTGAGTTTTTAGTGDAIGGGGSPANAVVDVAGTLRYWGPECGVNPTNHGGYVARATKGGTSRSTAAHSPCGKPMTSVSTTTSTSAASVTTTTAGSGGGSAEAGTDNSSGAGPPGSPGPSGHGHRQGGGENVSRGRGHSL